MSKEENRKNFSKYVSQNILGMIGFSCYVLADSYFISIAKGADGLTALNLVMPLYSIIFSIGEMIGVGSAIRYAISKIKKRCRCRWLFLECINMVYIVKHAIRFLPEYFFGRYHACSRS